MAKENQEVTPKINPFDLQWLSDNFGLDKVTVKTAKLNQHGMYDIRFNDPNAAEAFEKTMSAAKCFPHYFKFLNSVQLNGHLKNEIIEAAAARQKAISPPLIEHPVKKPLAIEGMPETSPDTVADQKDSDNNSEAVIENTSEINPFDLQWLSENFDLDRATVIRDEFNRHGMYEIYFKDLNAAEKFEETMDAVKCHPQLFKFANFVQLNKRHKDRIIEAAAARQKDPDNKEKRPAHQAITLFFAKSSSAAIGQGDTIENLSRYLKLALNAENDIGFIGYWMCAFQLVSSSAISIDRSLEPDVNYKSNHPGPPYNNFSDSRVDNEKINLFFEALYRENNMDRLDSVFSHIADWKEFYAAFRKKDHDSITKFAFLVHKVKDVPGDDSSLVFTLAKAALYHQENPYRIPRAALEEEAVASNSHNESWVSKPAP